MPEHNNNYYYDYHKSAVNPTPLYNSCVEGSKSYYILFHFDTIVLSKAHKLCLTLEWNDAWRYDRKN